MSAPTMEDKYATLATQCMEFCRHLDTKGKAFKFSVSIGSDFSFNLDTRGEATTSREVRKKLSPSSVKRNARRKQEFLKKKTVSSEESSTTSEKKSDNSDKELVTPEKPENTPDKAVKTKVDLEKQAIQQPASQQQASQPASQPWRRPSTCRRCGLSTKGHPGPYGEGRCRVSLSGLPSKIRIEKCSDCFDHPRPPCDTHRKPLADQFKEFS